MGTAVKFGNKRTPVAALTFLSLLFAGRLFYGLPHITYYVIEAFISGLCFLWVSAYYLKSRKIETIILFFLALPLVAALGAVASASANFSQPLVYGLLAQRSYFVVFIPIALWIQLNRTGAFGTCIQTLSGLSKIYLVIVLVLPLIIPPQHLVENFGIDNPFVSYFVDFSYSLREYRYKLNPLPVVLLVLMIWFDGAKLRRELPWFCASIYWILFTHGGRGLIAAVLAAFVVGGFAHSNRRVSLTKLLILIGLAGIVLASLAFSPSIDEHISVRIGGFKQALAVLSVSNAGDIADVSALARVQAFQAVTHLANIRNVMFGVGALSQQWNDGYGSVFGRFHPSDLGLIGAIVVYGVVYTIMLMTPFLVAVIRAWRSCSSLCVALLVYIVVSTALTGALIFHISLSFFFVVILRCFERPSFTIGKQSL